MAVATDPGLQLAYETRDVEAQVDRMEHHMQTLAQELWPPREKKWKRYLELGEIWHRQPRHGGHVLV